MLTNEILEWVQDSFTLDSTPSYLWDNEAVVEYFDSWSDYEESATVLIYSYFNELYVVERSHCVMAEDNYSKWHFTNRKLSLEEALDLITEFQTFRDSIVCF